MMHRITTLSLYLLTLCALPLFSMQQGVQTDTQEQVIKLQTDDDCFSVPARYMRLCKLFKQESDFTDDDSQERTIYWTAIKSSAWKLVAPQLETILQLKRVKKELKALKAEYWFIHYGRTTFRADLMSKKVWDRYKDYVRF